MKARPVSDAGNFGGWSPTPLWQQLDDEDDTSQVASQNSTNPLGFAVNLETVAASTGISTGWLVVATGRVVAGDFSAASVRVGLYQGGSELAGATTALPSTGSWASIGFELSPAEVAAIAFPAALQVDVLKLASGTACGVACGQVYLFVPEGFEHLDFDPTLGGALKVAGPGSGHYLILGAGGSYQRVAGVEGTGALYLDAGIVKVRP